MAVEDHPIEYADFEGRIPKGHYGAGTVVIWDRGTYELEDDADAATALRKGELKFTLGGRRLKGSWVLVRRDAKSWLLIKRRDRHAAASHTAKHAP